MAILRLDTGRNAYIPHIHIGREAENDISQIDFVVQSWIDTYGDGGVSLAVQRYGDKEAYIVPLAIVDGVATWTISDTDTAKEGLGSVQLTYVVGEKVKKSQIYKIVVDSSLVGSDAVPDPYDNWLAVLTEMTAQTGANADSARVSAQAAAQSEENAKTSEDNAKASETAADLSKENAKASEVNAKASEEAAARAAASASASAVNASAYAHRAETAESNAQHSAASAKANAESAKTDADRAEQAAATATAKAQEATQDAQTASAAALAATAKASEASTSASTASTAATTATHKAQEASDSATTAQTAQTAAQTAQTAAESARDEAQASAESIDPDTLKNTAYNAYVAENASGAVASFSDGADDIPVKDLTIAIEPVQEGSGDPSPDNVRPITGWTGCEVQRTGGNQLQNNPFVSPSNGISCSILTNDCSAVLSGTATATIGFTVAKMPVRKGVTYTVSVENASASCVVNVRRYLGTTYVSMIKVFVASGTETFTVDDTFDTVDIRPTVPNGETISDYVIKYSIAVGTKAAPFSPYNGITIPVSFPTEAGTVYGGYVDVINGELVVDRAMVANSNRAFKYETKNGYYWYTTANDLGVAGIAGLNAKLISNRLKRITNVTTSSREGELAWYANNIIRWTERGELDQAEYLEYLANNPLQLCYELATPITYQLTPQEVSTLLGQNNIWADTGDTSVDYRADTKLYIDRLTAPDSDMVADTNIASDKYFVVNNTLYLSTSAIASGAEIVPGTNCTETSIAEALNTINA